MELFVYHFKEFFYYSFAIILGIRFILNWTIYHKIDSQITNRIPDYYEIVPPTTAEKEKLQKTRKYVNDVTLEHSDGFQLIHIALTFWWSVEQWDNKNIIRMKRVANNINLAQILLLVIIFLMFLFFQDVDWTYRKVEKDLLYFLK